MSEGLEPVEAPEHADLFRIGDVLSGQYEVKGILGAGGNGQVFDALDLVLLRRVAIKVAWPHLPPHVLRKEAQALAAIRHSSMVTVFAVGQHEDVGQDGRPRRHEYVVMERIQGTSIETLLDQAHASGRTLSLAEVLDILIAIADGLAKVHAAGVAHHDIKPGNVMMAPGNRIVLVDLGLFRPEFEGSGGSIVGSPPYMAPEAILGKTEPGAGNLVDLYALGIMAFELLTGGPPFSDDDVRVILRKHLREQPPSVTALRPDTPPELETLIFELLQKDPRDRPQHAEAVSFQLRKLQQRTAERQPSAKPLSLGNTKSLAPEKPLRLTPSLRATPLPRIEEAPPSAQRKNPSTSFGSDRQVDEKVRDAMLARRVSDAALSVLVVDDDEDLQRVMSYYVRTALPMATVRVARDGEHALEAVRTEEPNLIFLDLQMPRMNGIEVTMFLRGAGLSETCEIICVSAGAQEHDVLLLRQLGVKHFVEKGPGLANRVSETLRTLLPRLNHKSSH